MGGKNTNELAGAQQIIQGLPSGEHSISTLARCLISPSGEIAAYITQYGVLVDAAGNPFLKGGTSGAVTFLTVANAAARLSLTVSDIQNGGHVKESDTGDVYELLDQTAIGSTSSWAKMTPIRWADIVGKPTVFPSDIANVSGLSLALSTLTSADVAMAATIASHTTSIGAINVILSGRGNAFSKNVGTTPGTVAAGDDSRFGSGGGGATVDQFYFTSGPDTAAITGSLAFIHARNSSSAYTIQLSPTTLDEVSVVILLEGDGGMVSFTDALGGAIGTFVTSPGGTVVRMYGANKVDDVTPDPFCHSWSIEAQAMTQVEFDAFLASSSGHFNGDISGDNLSGNNTGDQDLSGFATLSGANFTGSIGTTGNINGVDLYITNVYAEGNISALNLQGSNTGDNSVNSRYSGLVSNATHTGDATGSTALTVVKINGVSLAGLATGILKNTTTTGAPSIAVAADFPTLNQSTTGNAATATALATARAINGTNFDGTAAITVTAAASTLTGTTLNSTVVTSSLTSVGTLTAGATGAGFTINFGTSTTSGTVPSANLPTASTSVLGAVKVDGTTVTISAGVISAAGGTILGTANQIINTSGTLSLSPTLVLPGTLSTPGLLTITQGTANAGVLVSTGYSLTGSSAVNAVDLAGTWNTSGNPTLLKANVTNTASGASALLLDLQVGGTSQAKISKAGTLTLTGAIIAPTGLGSGFGQFLAWGGSGGYMLCDRSFRPNSDGVGTIDIGASGARWSMGYFALGFRFGSGTAGATILVSGTSPNESLVLTPGGTGIVSVVGPLTVSGDVALSKTVTASGTTGAQTINKSTGRVNFAAAATSLVVTNSLCTANSIIQCTIATNDATAANVKCVAGVGSFTIYLGTAPTAETAVNFTLTN